MKASVGNADTLKTKQKPYTIVMMDDNMSLLTLFCTYFQKHGHALIPVHDPRHLGRKITEHDPDAILMDINMSDARGDEMIKLLRKKGCDIPIFVVSGYINEELIVRLKDYRVDGYFSKTTSVKNLNEKIISAIRTLKSRQKKPTNNNVTRPAVIISAEKEIRNDPAKVIPIEIISDYMLDIHTTSSLPDALETIKSISGATHILLVDAVNESQVLQSIRTLQSLHKKSGVPVCFFSKHFSKLFVTEVSKSGFEYFFKYSDNPKETDWTMLHDILNE